MRMMLVSLFCLALGFAASAAPGELKVGDTAPDFTLQASDGHTYKLADFKGKQAVVVALFPKAVTQGCTIECKSLAEHGDMIKKYNVKYFMASVDPVEGEKGNKAFAAAHNADFPLLGDETKKTALNMSRMGSVRASTRWISRASAMTAPMMKMMPTLMVMAVAFAPEARTGP